MNKRQLRKAIYEAGLSREQLGSRGVKVRGRDGSYVMTFDAERVEVDDLNDAIAQLESWAEDAEIEFTDGAIVGLTAAINRWFAKTPYVTASGRDDFYDRLAKLVADAGLDSWNEALETKPFDGEPLCYVSDSLYWCVYVNAANEARYIEGTARDDDRPPGVEELPDA